MKATDMLNKVKEVLGVELAEEPKKVELAQAELENGTVIESEFTEGSEIFIVTEDEKVPLPVGSYKLVDGESLIVEEEGIIKSIGKVEEEEVEAEEEKKEEMNYATKEELEEVKKMVEEIKMAILPKEEEMSEEAANQVKSEETTTKTVYAEKDEKQELEKVEKVNHNPESESKPNLNLHGQNRSATTLDRIMSKLAK